MINAEDRRERRERRGGPLGGTGGEGCRRGDFNTENTESTEKRGGEERRLFLGEEEQGLGGLGGLMTRNSVAKFYRGKGRVAWGGAPGIRKAGEDRAQAITPRERRACERGSLKQAEDGMEIERIAQLS